MVIRGSDYPLQISRDGCSETSDLECAVGYRFPGPTKTDRFPFSDICSIYTMRDV